MDQKPFGCGYAALCFHIRSLDPARFLDPKTGLPNLSGALSPARMADVDQALKLVLNLA